MLLALAWPGKAWARYDYQTSIDRLYYTYGQDHAKLTAIFDAQIREHPDDPIPYALRVKNSANIKDGSLEQFQADLAKAWELGQKDPRILTWHGQAQLKLERYQEALAEANRALALKPDDQDAFCLRGMAYRGLGRYREALSDLTKVIQAGTDAAVVYIERGQAEEGLKETSLALADYDRAIKLAPDYDYCYYRRANIYYVMNSYSKARDDLEKAAQLAPKNPDIPDLLGYVYLDAGDPAKAWKSFDLAIGLGRKDSDVYAMRGKAALELGRPDDCIADATMALGYDQTNIMARLLRSWGYLDKSEFAKAVSDLERFNQEVPDGIKAYKWLASAYAGLDDFDRALAAVNKSLSQNGDNSEDFILRSTFYYQLGQYQKSLDDAGRAARTAGEEEMTTIYLIMAKNYTKLKRYPEAREYCQRHLSACSDRQEALDLLKEIDAATAQKP